MRQFILIFSIVFLTACPSKEPTTSPRLLHTDDTELPRFIFVSSDFSYKAQHSFNHPVAHLPGNILENPRTFVRSIHVSNNQGKNYDFMIHNSPVNHKCLLLKESEISGISINIKTVDNNGAEQWLNVCNNCPKTRYSFFFEGPLREPYTPLGQWHDRARPFGFEFDEQVIVNKQAILFFLGSQRHVTDNPKPPGSPSDKALFHYYVGVEKNPSLRVSLALCDKFSEI